MFCSLFSHIEYVSRIHLVNISLIFINYAPSTIRLKVFGSQTLFWTHVVNTHSFFMNLKTLLGPDMHSKPHACTSGKTPVLRERSYHMTRRAVVSRVIRVQRRYAVRIRPMDRWPGITLVRFLNYLLSGT